MPWVKLDDAMGEHRKMRRLMRKGGPTAVALHFLAITHSSRYLTDGRVDLEFIEDVGDLMRRKTTAMLSAVDALVSAELWHQVDEGSWLIHDYLDHNPSRSQVEEQRRKDRERKATGGRGGKPKTAGVSHSDPGSDLPDSVRNPSGIHSESGSRAANGSGSPVPYPSRPVPSHNPPSPPSGGNRHRDREGFERSLAAWGESVVPEADGSVVLAATKHALSRLRPGQQNVRGVRWIAASDPADPFGLGDEVRAGIRREFVSVVEGAA